MKENFTLEEINKNILELTSTKIKEFDIYSKKKKTEYKRVKKHIIATKFPLHKSVLENGHDILLLYRNVYNLALELNMLYTEMCNIEIESEKVIKKLQIIFIVTYLS